MTRGIRNNNPFNIRRTQVAWLGEVVESSDKDFEQFESMYYGLRAGIKLLKNYIQRGYDTPEKIIARYAPASENDCFAYTLFLLKDYNLPICAKIEVASLQFFRLCQGICKFESDYDLSYSQFKTIASKFHIFN